jgi:chromosome segregation ATPase
VKREDVDEQVAQWRALHSQHQTWLGSFIVALADERDHFRALWSAVDSALQQATSDVQEALRKLAIDDEQLGMRDSAIARLIDERGELQRDLAKRSQQVTDALNDVQEALRQRDELLAKYAGTP